MKTSAKNYHGFCLSLLRMFVLHLIPSRKESGFISSSFVSHPFSKYAQKEPTPQSKQCSAGVRECKVPFYPDKTTCEPLATPRHQNQHAAPRLVQSWDSTKETLAEEILIWITVRSRTTSVKKLLEVRIDAVQFDEIQTGGIAFQLLAQLLQSNTGLRYEPNLPNKSFTFLPSYLCFLQLSQLTRYELPCEFQTKY